MSTNEDSPTGADARAREWHTLMNSGVVDEATRRAFEGWLHADKEHKRAYFGLEQMWRDLDFVAMEAGVDASGMNTPSFLATWRYRLAGLLRPPVLLPTGFAASALAILIAVVIFTPAFLKEAPSVQGRPTPAYVTNLAEIRVITLEDGSVVTLGAKSQMDTVFTQDSRHVVLHSGEAFFEVAKDASRPFFVSVNDTLIRVVGTKFDVKRTADNVHVSVLEGIVDVMKTEDMAQAVTTPLAPIETKRLTAGQKIIANAAPTLPDVEQVEQAMPGAWRSGRLAYENASLAEIIADINRYHDRSIRLVGADIGDIRFTSAFQADEIAVWLEVLKETQNIDVIDRGTGQIILRQRS